MCQYKHQRPRELRSADEESPPRQDGDADAFPWHLPVYDAHCHPTDTMSSIANLATMRASVLSIMASRSQDQDLVDEVASLHCADSRAALRRHCPQTTGQRGMTLTAPRGCQIIPSFGWHPWFSHQMYDDAVTKPTYRPPAQHETGQEALLDAKRSHYRAVLAPPPHDDALIASLPTPIPVSSFIGSTRQRLGAHPHALVGEIGLDKAFRLPGIWDPVQAASRDDGLTPGGREGRRLSPHRVSMQHQQAILLSQLRLAGEFARPVSLHGVQAHGVLFDVVSSCWKGHEKHVSSRREKRQVAVGAEDDTDQEDVQSLGGKESGNGRGTGTGNGKPYPPRICLHSYSGPVEYLRQWLRPSIPATIYFSFSSAVNCGTDAASAKLADVVAAVPDDRLLVESDLHVAGQDMDAALEDMYRRVCSIKSWTLEKGVAQIAANYEDFIFGMEGPRRT